MTFTINAFYRADPFVSEIHAFGSHIQTTFNSTSEKIKKILTSDSGKKIIGFGLGFSTFHISGFLTSKIIKGLGIKPVLPDSFKDLNLASGVLITLLLPVIEKEVLGGSLQDILKAKFDFFYKNQGFSGSTLNMASRVTAIFFASLIFGAAYFSKALIFGCSPILFLPQVISVVLINIIFRTAKEVSADLTGPMAIGQNVALMMNFLTLLRDKRL